MKKFFAGLLALVAVLIIGGAGFLAIAPPERLLVATNFAAKIVCSNSFMAGRNADEVMANDIVPIDPSLQLVTVENDDSARVTRASMLGLFASAKAVHTPGAGCRNVYDDSTAPLADAQADAGGDVQLAADINSDLQSLVENDELAGPGFRAVLVLRDGMIVAERYADGFNEKTPLLGWSMTKTVTAAIIGRLEQQGVLSRRDTGLFQPWQGDARKDISVADLLGMASGLNWDEGYAAVSDVTRLLYLEPQPAAYVLDKPLDAADGSRIGQDFNYSSGTSVALSRYWVDRLEAARATGRDLPASSQYPEQALFEPLGMKTAVIERAADAFIGGSYMYAPAREWALFGQFLLDNGRSGGEQLLPPDYVRWMFETHPASQGRYARGHMWVEPPRARDARGAPVDPALESVRWLAGHDGQSVGIIPQQNMVVVRLGQTPSKLGYRPEFLAKALIDAVN